MKLTLNSRKNLYIETLRRLSNNATLFPLDGCGGLSADIVNDPACALDFV